MSNFKGKKRLMKLNESRAITWEQALEEFLMWKKAEGKSPRTLRDYSYHVKLFFKRFGAVFNDNQDLKVNVIQYMGEEVKPAYFNNKLVYLKIFFCWCVKENIISTNPLQEFKRRKADSRIVQLDNEVVKKLLELPNKKTYSGLRDYALLLLQLDTGIRPNEALSIQVYDANIKALEVYVRAENAKTRVARTLPISQITAKAIQKLIYFRPREWGDDVPIFSTCDGKKFSVNGWYKRVSEYGRVLGVKIFNYQFRHHFALEFLRNGANAMVLAKTLGHADLNMSKRYVSLVDKDMKEQHYIASPVSNLLERNKRIRNLK